MISREGSRWCGGQGQQGLTLLEILVAVVILSLSYVAVLRSFSQSSAGISRLERSRPAELSEILAFDQQLREAGAGAPLALAGDVVVEGQRFSVVKIRSKDGQLEMLRLVKR